MTEPQSKMTAPGFTGLTADNFAAYAPEKWSSNVYNLARMRAKENLLKLCQEAQSDLPLLTSSLVRASTDEVPNLINHKKVDAQWVYWLRNAEDRKSLASWLEKTELTQEHIFEMALQEKHVCIAVILKQLSLWVGIIIAEHASIDRRNLASKLTKPWQRQHFLTLLTNLPGAAHIGFGEPGLASDLRAVTELQESDLENLTGELLKNPQPLLIGYTVPQEEVLAAGSALAPSIHDWLAALSPCYQVIAWTKENDLIEATKQLQEEKSQKRRHAANYYAGDKVRINSGLFAGKTGVVIDTDTKAQVKVRVGMMTIVIPGEELQSM